MPVPAWAIACTQFLHRHQIAPFDRSTYTILPAPSLLAKWAYTPEAIVPVELTIYEFERRWRNLERERAARKARDIKIRRTRIRLDSPTSQEIALSASDQEAVSRLPESEFVTIYSSSAMAAPAHQIPVPGYVTSWKSAAVQAQERYNRLQILGYHAGFTSSPFWPRSIHELNGHKAEWQRQMAEEYKAQLEVTLAVHKRKMERAELYEPLEEIKLQTGWKRKKSKKLSLETEVFIVGCMEKVEKELTTDVGRMGDEEMGDLKERVEAVLKEFRERIEVQEIKNRNMEQGLSKVLGLKTTYWKGNEAELPEGQRDSRRFDGESRAYWPGHTEFKVEGDERVKSKGLPRRLPLPRLDLLSKERRIHYFQQYTGEDPNEEFRVLTEMVKLTGPDIEPEHRLIADFEGPIDSLESVKLRYAEEIEEKRKDKASAENVASPASSGLGNFAIPSGAQFMGSRRNLDEGVFNPPSHDIQRAADGRRQGIPNRRDEDQAYNYMSRATEESIGSQGSYDQPHRGPYDSSQHPGRMRHGETGMRVNTTGRGNGGPGMNYNGSEYPYPHELDSYVATRDHGNAAHGSRSRQEYEGGSQAKGAIAGKQDHDISAPGKFERLASGFELTNTSTKSEDELPSDFLNENELRELVGWDFVLDALNA